MVKNYFEMARDLQHEGRPFVLATVVHAEKPTSAKAGAKALVMPDGKLKGWVGGSCAEPTVIREARQALLDGKPRLLRLCPPEHLGKSARKGTDIVEVALTCASGGTLEVYIEPHLPTPQLVVIGHLPVAEALATLGKNMGFSVTAICAGESEASEDRLPADRLLTSLDFSQVQVHANTYIVVASHGNYDEEALENALQTGISYIALVASKKRGDKVLAYLREKGLSEDQLARIKYPAGLDIGAETPEEIALRILAEIVQIRRKQTPVLN
ncbi:MAG: XdhC family protein, partial [Calditrichaeota bacterium]